MKENIRRRRISGGKENQRRKRREIFGEDLSRILRSLGFGFGLGLETLPIFGGFRYPFQRIWSREKSLSFGFGEFGLGKKVSVLVSENLVSEKKSQFQKIGYRKKSLGIGFGQNFGIDIQWCRGQTGCCLRHFLWTTLLPSNLNMSQF